MHGGDGRLQSIRTDAAGRQRLLHQAAAFRDLRVVPERSILVVEQHQFAVRGHARGAAGVVQQHQREQPVCFRFGQQLHEQAPERDGLGWRGRA